MTRIALCFLAVFHFIVQPAAAQDRQPDSFVQIEFHPDLDVARQALRAYDRRLEDVTGFAMGAGWYAVTLGPYTRDGAEGAMTRLRREGLIPRDSFVARGADYRRQIWPEDTASDATTVSATAAGSTRPAATAASSTRPEVVRPAPAGSERPETLPEETRFEARQSERRLSRAERRQLQIALQWADHYQGRIDAVIGPGTRAAMRQWQSANGHAPTGVLTTRQRAELLRQYNAVLEGLELALVRDPGTGIRMELPLGAVAFDRYEPPFAHFDPTGEVPGARVLLISQPGDRDTLVGLYDIMQTLRIVPPEGERGVEGDGFTLVGRNDEIVSYTQAALQGGEIKGFTLIWPAGDSDRRTRLLAKMRASFERIEGVLDPAAATEAAQGVDLVAGLEIRRPTLSRSGFYVDRSGAVVTTLEAVKGCERITIDEDYDARVVARDSTLDVAVLRPVEPLSPISVAAFQTAPPRLQSDVAVAGYSHGGILGAPTLTFGELAGMRGLNGEEELKRLALNALEGDAGGPVVGGNGAVLGMLLPDRQDGRKLPEEVSFAADAEALTAFLEGVGVATRSKAGGRSLAPETLAKRASGMTVLVSCWE
jgi:peptidoglycan hydrolase-like protein with peptidoglycan-binding domain